MLTALRRSRWKWLIISIAAGLVSLPAGAGAKEPTLQAAGAGPAPDGTMSAAARTAMEEGALVPDQEAYERQKARANAAAGADVAASEFAPLAPVLSRSYQGVFDLGSAPSDSTGAVGSTRYIELINRKFAIYTKTSNAPIGSGTLNTLFGQASTANSFDPQTMWDPGTNRFYYAGDTVRSASDNVVSIGFSKTASPTNGTTDWCHYEVGFGSRFPDYPKLGDSSRFMIVGVNSFGPAGFLGSDAFGLSKPPAGTTCPAASTFKFGLRQNLTGPTAAGPGTAPVFTPVPANQTDSATTGYLVARTISLPSTRFSLHRVTADTGGNPVFQNPGLPVTVPSYNVPADARQKTPSVKLLDTLDARPTQAVAAVDPARLTTPPGAIWTQHTTAGGVGAEVRWYEINPVTRAVLQTGKVTSASLFNFNAAISPDRARFGTAGSGGDSMVMGYTASGDSHFPLLRMVSKVGAAAQSAPVNVRTSPGNYIGFDCAGTDNACRWGDYSAATPDPTPPAGTTRVWMTNQYASGATSTTQANWRSWNWAARP